MKGKGMGGHQRHPRGKTDDWLTPPDLIEKLGAFDLDPACPAGMPWRTAQTMWTPATNGLRRKWRGRVWLNPPYGNQTGRWLKRLAEHGNGIALVFARTETDTFFRWCWEQADALLFLRGRLYFYDVNGVRSGNSAGAPSVLVAYGASNVRSLAESGLAGQLIQFRGPGRQARARRRCSCEVAR